MGGCEVGAIKCIRRGPATRGALPKAPQIKQWGGLPVSERLAREVPCWRSFIQVVPVRVWCELGYLGRIGFVEVRPAHMFYRFRERQWGRRKKAIDIIFQLPPLPSGNPKGLE